MMSVTVAQVCDTTSYLKIVHNTALLATVSSVLRFGNYDIVKNKFLHENSMSESSTVQR